MPATCVSGRSVRSRSSSRRRATKALPLEQLRPAHYALCASLDDVVLNTPWGSSGNWSDRSLVSTFHQEVRSGERFFQLLRQMCDNPGKFLPVIELMYLCMSLGFMASTACRRAASASSTGIREETYALIVRQQNTADPELAPHAKGIYAPYRPARIRVPLWVAASAGLALVAGLFLWFSISLNAASDGIYTRLRDAPPTQMPTITRTPIVEPKPAPTPLPPPEPTALDKTRQFLKPEIDQGLVRCSGRRRSRSSG